MAKLARKVFGFIGFLLGVWLFGKGTATAGIQVSGKDLSASSRVNALKQYDISRFARTGEIRANRKVNLFAYACVPQKSQTIEQIIAGDSGGGLNVPDTLSTDLYKTDQYICSEETYGRKVAQFGVSNLTQAYLTAYDGTPVAAATDSSAPKYSWCRLCLKNTDNCGKWVLTTPGCAAAHCGLTTWQDRLNCHYDFQGCKTYFRAVLMNGIQ
ncbi:MAG: hypothetical protein LBB23_01010 [Rickettsiales bacterium]|nr:hypothetical protein [Rickettsiales bacterium]